MKYRRSQFFSLSLQMFEGVTLPDPHIFITNKPEKCN